MGYKYFENTECEYYPCHNSDRINCLFCFCPLYKSENCGGNFSYIYHNGNKIKDCSNCLFPHRAENYDKIIKKLSEDIG